MHTLFSSGSEWETAFGYSSAVRVNDTLYISGISASGPDGQMVGDNSYSQTRYILKKIGAMLHDAGFTYADVVQTRLSLPDLTSWPGIARAYKETFETIRPAFSVHHVLPFLNPTLLLEIEVTAVKDQTPNS